MVVNIDLKTYASWTIDDHWSEKRQIKFRCDRSCNYLPKIQIISKKEKYSYSLSWFYDFLQKISKFPYLVCTKYYKIKMLLLPKFYPQHKKQCLKTAFKFPMKKFLTKSGYQIIGIYSKIFGFFSNNKKFCILHSAEY